MGVAGDRADGDPVGMDFRRKSALAMKPAKSAESWTESRSKPTQVSIVRALVSTSVPTPTIPSTVVGASGGPWVWNTPWGTYASGPGDQTGIGARYYTGQ